MNQLFGVNQFPTFMANTHRLLARATAITICNGWRPAREVRSNFGKRKAARIEGIIPPRFVVEKVLKEMRAFVAQPASTNILASSFKTRVAKIAGLNEQQRSDYQARVESAITAQVYPAYHKLIDYFQALLAKTTTDDGVWKLPEGEAYYTYLLRLNTTTTMSPTKPTNSGCARSRISVMRLA